MASCILGETEFQQVDGSVPRSWVSHSRPQGTEEGLLERCSHLAHLAPSSVASEAPVREAKWEGPGLMRHTCVWLPVFFFFFFTLATPPTLKKRLCCENTQLFVLFSLPLPPPMRCRNAAKIIPRGDWGGTLIRWVDKRGKTRNLENL